jgi:hypothetical protein
MNRALSRMEQGARGLEICRKRGRFYVTVRDAPGGRRYGKKMAMRRAYMKLMEDWHMVGGILHRSWSARGDDGQRAFIAANMQRQSQGRPLELFGGQGPADAPGMVAAPGSSPGEIMLAHNFDGAGGAYCTVFTQRIHCGLAAGLMQRHDCGALSAPVSLITGLAPGESYFCYAVATDREFIEASVVFASTACSGVARMVGPPAVMG